MRDYTLIVTVETRYELPIPSAQSPQEVVDLFLDAAKKGLPKADVRVRQVDWHDPVHGESHFYPERRW